MGYSNMDELGEFGRINNLYDIYRPLFTSKQILIMDDYFKYNLSLSEISEMKKISRSAVSDTITKCKKKLDEYENKLHIFERNEKIIKILEDEKIDDATKKKILKELYYGI